MAPRALDAADHVVRLVFEDSASLFSLRVASTLGLRISGNPHAVQDVRTVHFVEVQHQVGPTGIPREVQAMGKGGARAGTVQDTCPSAVQIQ
eukprot:CAMPEP_0174376164 /NCGR_PEP_ID=MMETSP0811_2-20130205/117187_1 /TAXON_ID=73025 ORGANISM="Eutreptiella gymnastica-like, Strain CCMP1594" /NCGR_SAMPLE_ID=MMETSP0811_2 /ASSEMBLY_ACC=CAM_ASM_000667 /LENGTH=91 /DNA_ID=CAMNT_0015527073 /DNA_START=512 /DNA_END=784 /DNA_ORIENTATION=-